ncbi:MAG: transcriptional regulator, partial [Haloarculaceae archaeon]
SRRTVSKYEDGMDASVEVASKLEEMFDAPLTSPVEVLDGADEVREGEPTPDDPDLDPEDEPIVAVLTRVGFEVHPTDRAPFKTVSENESREEEMLTGHSELTKTAEKRARIMSSVGAVIRTRSVYVVDHASREAVEDTAIIEEDEMERITQADELRDLIRERTDREEPA